MRVIGWVNTTLNHIDTRAILPAFEGSCLVYKLNSIKIKIFSKYPYPTDIEKCDILILDTQVVLEKDNISPTLDRTNVGPVYR